MTASAIGLPGVRVGPRGFKDCLASDRPKLRRLYREKCVDMAKILLERLYVSRQLQLGIGQMVDLAGLLRSDARQCAPLCRVSRTFEVEPALVNAVEGLARLAEAEADIQFAAGALVKEAPLLKPAARPKPWSRTHSSCVSNQKT